MISGLANFFGGLLGAGALASALGMLPPIAEAAARIGYGVSA